MERQTVIRSIAIAFAGVGGLVFFAQRYIAPQPPVDAAAARPDVSGASSVALGGVMSVGDSTRRDARDEQVAALDLGTVDGSAIEGDFQPPAARDANLAADDAPADDLSVVTLSDIGVDPGRSAERPATAAPEPAARGISDDEFFVSSVSAPADTATPAPAMTDAGVSAEADACAATLSVEASVDALARLALDAPCNPDERVVISHGDLVFTAMTDSAGALSLYAPAFSERASFDVLLSDDTHLRGSANVPDAAGHVRVTVQWSGDLPLALNAFHNGAGFGEAGHLSAASPFDPDMDAAFLIELGDADMADPMLAQVYSVPVTQAHRVRLDLEAPVTAANCGADMLAHVLRTGPGLDPDMQDLQVAMPGCDQPDGFVIVPLSLPQAGADQLARN